MKYVPPANSRSGTFRHFAGLLSAAVQYLNARLTLLGLEAREAGANGGIAGAMIAGGLVVAVLGYVLLIMTVVFGIAAAFEGAHVWIFVMGGAALLHLAGAVALVSLAWRRLKIGAFHTTLEELRKDRQWLTNLAKNP
jgi:uncharacterized membrane protein YqjE